jgi:hypothetical protein
MLSSNEQSLEFNRERMNREIEARVTRELVKREKKLKKKKIAVIRTTGRESEKAR